MYLCEGGYFILAFIDVAGVRISSGGEGEGHMAGHKGSGGPV